jgi:protein disulfide-isomerase A6
MVHAAVFTAAAAAILLALPCSAGGLYTKNSPVLQVDAKNYDRLIAKSNHTSVSSWLDTHKS